MVVVKALRTAKGVVVGFREWATTNQSAWGNVGFMFGSFAKTMNWG